MNTEITKKLQQVRLEKIEILEEPEDKEVGAKTCDQKFFSEFLVLGFMNPVGTEKIYADGAEKKEKKTPIPARVKNATCDQQ